MRQLHSSGLMMIILYQFVLLLFITLVTAGVYPNYRADFDFRPLNNSDNIVNKVENNKNDWWKTANFYQIYPRSFKDSNNDGIGDLKGITSQLFYLKEIGVTATWLSPIFKSPMVDFGYDISDYYEIHEDYGTMDDFNEMIAEAKKNGIKIILDFVPNHSSNESEWFIKSTESAEPYKDFYVWHEGKTDPKNPKGRKLPPSNWISMFRGPAWTWNDKRQAYYLHQFASAQPDLNFNNPAVNIEMKKVLKFWLDKGVDGFRIDAVPFVFECDKDKDGNFQDEPVRKGATDPEDYGYLVHNCTVDQPETLNLVYDWRTFMDNYQKANNTDTKVLLTEQWSPLEIALQYYGDGKGKLGSHVPFNFFVITNINNDTNAKGYADTINLWLKQMNDFRIPNWVLGNHDKNRVGSRLGTDRIDMMNMMIMTLPGIAVTYQGEEIGMTDVWLSWEETKDPQACNSNKENYERLSRDPERTPFQWNDDVNAGFNTGHKTWLPVSDNYNKVNVKRERGIARSKLNIYKALRELRNDDVFKGNFKAKVVALNDNVLGILRSHNNRHYITLLNIMDKTEVLNLKKSFPELTNELEYVVVTDRSPHSFGDKTLADGVVLLPKESVVLRSIDSKTSLKDYYHYNIVN